MLGTLRRRRGRSIGIDTFGASADGARIMKEYGVTAEAVTAARLESILTTTR